jgi:hypothetical protein
MKAQSFWSCRGLVVMTQSTEPVEKLHLTALAWRDVGAADQQACTRRYTYCGVLE